MPIVIAEDRPIATLDENNPRCLACGAAMDPEFPLACPDDECGAGYLVNGLPTAEHWPWVLDDIPNPNPVPTLMDSNSGAYLDWCSVHGEYEEDNFMTTRSCRYYAAEARELRWFRDRYLSAPPKHADATYSELLRRIYENPHFARR